MEPAGKRKSEQQMSEGRGLTMREGYKANKKKKKGSMWLLAEGLNNWLIRWESSRGTELQEDVTRLSFQGAGACSELPTQCRKVSGRRS